jgi:hypothetical protein
VTAPGDDTKAKTRILETGTALLQGKQLLEALNDYIDDFHFYNGDMKGQMEAHHYCSVVNEDTNQCVIFEAKARTQDRGGWSNIISGNLFESLGGEERKLWHGHEVKSGELVAPRIPEKAEHEFWRR